MEKGRVVFQGNNVTDQESNAAFFQEIASSANAISTSKFIDANLVWKVALVCKLTLNKPTVKASLVVTKLGSFFRDQ